MNDYDGLQILDRDGSSIGTVERSFADDNDVIRMVEVKIGTLFAKHRLIPVDNVEPGEAGLVVPYSKQTIEDSPEIAGGTDTLEGDTLRRVRQYYGGGGPSTASNSQDFATEADAGGPVGSVPVGDVSGVDRSLPEASVAPPDITTPAPPPGAEASSGEGQVSAGSIRDAGDYIEVPIIEERLVKQAVVKEVLRIRKRNVGTQEIVREDLRSEHVEVDPDADVPVRDNR